MRRLLCALIALVLLLSHAAAEAPRYRIETDLSSQITTVYRADDSGEIVRQMICSSGTPDSEDATPCGEFTVKHHYSNERSEWYYIKKYKVYVQYVTRFNGPYLYHSLPFAQKDASTVDQEALSQLGLPVSHGCIRLRSEDAKWIALNCPDGTPVRIFESGTSDDEVRAMLLDRSYVAAEWDSYAQFRAAFTGRGLVGALEQLDEASEN